MDEIRKSAHQSGLNELEKIFQEYKSKLEHAEQEADEIIDAAWQKAEIIIADKQKEAQQIINEMKQRASQEAERIILEARNKAAELEKESAGKAKKDAKDKTKREADRIIADTRQAAENKSAEIIDHAGKEAKEIVQKARDSAQTKVLEESEVILTEAKEKARRIEEDSIMRAEETDKLIVEVSQEADEIFSRFRTQAQAELNDLATKLNKARNNLEIRSILDKNEVSSSDNNTIIGNDHVKGRRGLNILQPYDRSQIKELVETLKQIPSVTLDGEAGTEDSFSIYLNIAEPIPLRNILQELSLVESSDVRGETIRVKLKSQQQ